MQRCCSPHDEGVLIVSSTSSGRQLRKPNDHTCWGGETVPSTDDEQQNADAVSCRTSSLCGWYQITLLGDNRGTWIWTIYSESSRKGCKSNSLALCHHAAA